MAKNDISRPHFFEQGSSSRTLLLLHGTGADEFDLINLGKAIDPTASLLSPRGMFLEGGMNRFFERYPDGTFNEASIDSEEKELVDFLAAAVEHYELDASQIFGVGFSNGANMAAAILIHHPEVLTGAAMFGSTRPYKEVKTLNLTGKRIWLANGDQDSYAPVATSQDWVKQMKESGADVTWLRHLGGHQISGDHVSQIALGLSGN